MNIRIIQGDITEQKVDVIVNAANTSLLGGSGVDGAIHRKGGPEILEACRQIRNRQGSCPTGESVITTAGKLESQYVIHTVGPKWNGGNNHERELLGKCYVNSLSLAIEHGAKTIAFPNISTGIYGFPKDLACSIALSSVQGFSRKGELEDVIFVCFDDENYDLYKQAL